MSSEQIIVGTANVGTPRSLSEKHTMCFRFHSFPWLESELYVSPPLTCHGCRWDLLVYPKGESRAKNKSPDTEWVSIFLRCRDVVDGKSKSVRASFTIRLPTKNASLTGDFTNINTTKGGWGWPMFAPREQVIASCLTQDGTLEVQVDLQVACKADIVWKPEKTLQTQMLQLLKSGTEADVTFKVGEERFPAHKAILSVRCPALASIAAEAASSEEGEISFDTNADLFRALLHYVYVDELPPSFHAKGDSLELLELADRYGCSNLKLLCETQVVERHITPESAAELFLFADAHSCALLREASLDALAANPKSAMASTGWAALEKSGLLPEVTKTFVEPPQFDDKNTEHARISALRKRLAQAGQDVDGTREMLVKRLRTLNDDSNVSSEQQQESDT